MNNSCFVQVPKSLLNKLRDNFKLSKITGHEIDAYIVPNNDEHLNEYLAEGDARLKFLSGFTGTAATGVITPEKALLWTDGRYHIQAETELVEEWTLMKEGLPTTPSKHEWMITNLKKGSIVGADPTLISCHEWISLRTQLEKADIKFIPIKINLVDLIWDDKPERPDNPLVPMDIKYTGKKSKEKIEYIRKKMVEKNVQLYIVTNLEEIAWILNLRGSDIPFNPVFFSFLALSVDEIHLFVDQNKINENVKNHFPKEEIKCNLYSYDSIYTFISHIVKETIVEKIWIPKSANYEIYSLVPDNKKFCERSLIPALKAVKNKEECEGMIKAHIYDGISMCRFVAWLHTEIRLNGEVTELSGAEKLESFRKDNPEYIGPSFGTLSSSGPNAAIIHYHPKPETNRVLSRDEIYLCDSGSQYTCGTTDVTRTIHFGKPLHFQKECFTRVFKGYVALKTTIFPSKIKGNMLDTIARKALWDIGLDYSHGTGHGIGAHLCVHEFPPRIAKEPIPDDPGLQPNMFLSIEPGYYQKDDFGVRIEDIVRVVPAKVTDKNEETAFLTFDSVTLCPIQKRMLIISDLTTEEKEYLNNYHLRCLETLGPILKEKGYNEALLRLEKATAPI